MKLFAIFACLFSVLNLNSKETENKIYVLPNQVEIMENGFLARVGHQKPVVGKTLCFDDHGLYIKEWKGPCWIHDIWCNLCGGCGVLLCPMNCSCFD